MATWCSCHTIKNFLEALAGFVGSDQSEFTTPWVLLSSEEEFIHPAFMISLLLPVRLY